MSREAIPIQERLDVANRVSELHARLRPSGMKTLRCILRQSLKEDHIIAWKRLDNLLALSRIPVKEDNAALDVVEKIAQDLDGVIAENDGEIKKYAATFDGR